MILSSVTISVVGLQLFLLAVVGVAISHASTLFLSWHGWSHRLAGAALLCWIVRGAAAAPVKNALLYDTMLGLLGILATLTAATDFPHKRVTNAQGQSGSLSPRALVTQAEMVEHSFYQGLNLMQAWYLHGMSHYYSYHHQQQVIARDYQYVGDVALRMGALWLVTVPWYWRRCFPVHSFSNNWRVTPKHKRTDQEVLFYRIKKAQYMFYKHVLLHGLNISVATMAHVTTSSPFTITTTASWRIYWLALNTSYVMEFFLQSIMRRRIISAHTMFALQQLLMATASIAALNVLFLSEPSRIVQPLVCLLSLGLNLIHRHHDVTDVMGIALLWELVSRHYAER